MNKKTKKMMTIISVILVILICVAVAIMVTKKTDNEKQETVSGQEESMEQEKLETVEEEVPEPVEVKERVEASESEWLAAGMVIALSLHYPDFNIDEIYISSEEKKEACIIFTTEGEKTAIHSEPLDEERKEAGARDLYTKELGFATFDEISVDKADIKNMERIALEDLETLISQSLLVTVYEH